MQPQSMYLERMSQKEFLQQIDVNDPRNYLTQYMKLLLLEMDGNYDLSRRSNFIYNLTKNDVLTYHKYFAWCVGLGINLWCISVLRLDNNDERSERKLVSDVHLKSINIVSWVFSGYNFLILLSWLFFKTPIKKMLEFKKYKIFNRI